VITCLSCGSVKRYPVTRKKRLETSPISMKPYIAQLEPSPKKNYNKE
jgi:hypothetical protein